jgi:hypothetical protein
MEFERLDLIIRGLLMGRAPSSFRFEGSLCYIARVEVGPLLCVPIFGRWCLLLPTPYISSLFDTENLNWCQIRPVNVVMINGGH